MVSLARVQQPSAENKQIYEDKFARCEKILEALGPIWKEI